MCSFEVDEPCAEYNVNRTEAAGCWICEVCGAEIPPGAWCRSDFVLQEYADPDEGETDDDEWETFEVCFACDAAMTAFQRSHGSHATPDWFAESLRSCFDDVGDEKTDPDVKRWRDEYAGILRRGRAAARAKAKPIACPHGISWADACIECPREVLS